MLGPYTANKDKTISYRGNKIFEPIQNISGSKVPLDEFESRVMAFEDEGMWASIARINNTINFSVNNYFNEAGAIYTNLPLTTRMISSPGAVYGKEAINYTSDTCPITLKWFDLPNEVFLSESSQIYLELALMQQGLTGVYSIYNSFRKEKADATHLSEFHHVEFEGKVTQSENEIIILRLLKRIILDLLKNNLADLAYFLTSQKIEELKVFASNLENAPKLTFREVLDKLYDHTKDPKYKEFTMKHFGSWEEIKITEIMNNLVIITEYPLLEVPFYHAVIDDKDPKVANNSDFIWPGYRETIGSGHRVRSLKELEEKARIFNLPIKDYAPYMQTRKSSSYLQTSGFGLGWERLLHGLLEMPYIWSAVHFPRIDLAITP